MGRSIVNIEKGFKTKLRYNTYQYISNASTLANVLRPHKALRITSQMCLKLNTNNNSRKPSQHMMTYGYTICSVPVVPLGVHFISL